MPDADKVYLQESTVAAVQDAQVHIARLEERVENLTRMVNELRTSSAHMVAAIDEMQKTMAEAKGGWRTLVLLGGMLTSFGVFVGWLAQHFSWRVLP